MKLVLFATFEEARFTLDALKAIPNNKNSYHFSQGKIIITGIGSYAAQFACSQYVDINTDEIINLGFAGSLQTTPIGEVICCTTIGKYTSCPETLDETSEQFRSLATPIFSFPGNQGRLISSDFPIHSASIRSQLQKQWELIDMESYGIAFAAHHFQKKVTFIKIVSDFAKEGGRVYIEKHKKELSFALAQKVLNLM